MEALGFTAEDLIPSTSTSSFDWSAWNENRAYGFVVQAIFLKCETYLSSLSISLYERHPITGVSSGTPIADVFGIVSLCVIYLSFSTDFYWTTFISYFYFDGKKFLDCP